MVATSTAMIIAALASAGAGTATAALSGSDGPESFSGTNADPADWLSDVRGSLNSVLGGAMERAGQPIDLNWTNPQPLGEHPTSYIPHNIGTNFGTPQRVPISPGFHPTGPVGTGAGSILSGTPAQQTQRVQRDGQQLLSQMQGVPHGLTDDVRRQWAQPNAPTTPRAPAQTTGRYMRPIPSSTSGLPTAPPPAGSTTQARAAAELLLHSLMGAPPGSGQ